MARKKFLTGPAVFFGMAAVVGLLFFFNPFGTGTTISGAASFSGQTFSAEVIAVGLTFSFVAFLIGAMIGNMLSGNIA